MLAQSRAGIDSVGCSLDFWDCSNLNTGRIVRKDWRKIRGKIYPTEPRKPKDKVRYTCRYHDSCQDPPVLKKKSSSLKPTTPRTKPEKTFTLSPYHVDCDKEPTPLTKEKKIVPPTIPRIPTKCRVPILV